MVWHDCKTDPPKEFGSYVVIPNKYKELKTWMQGWYHPENGTWWDFNGEDIHPYKWAEVDLSEVE